MVPHVLSVSGTIQVRRVVPDSPERPIVAAYIVDRYRQWYGTSPVIPEMLFAAFGENILVGAFAFEICSEQRAVVWARCFDCGSWTAWLDAHRDCLIEFGRWAADSPLASAAVLLAVIREAARLGKQFGLSVAKPKIAGYIRSTFAVEMRIIEEAVVRLDPGSVPDDEREYYDKHQPRLHLVDLARADGALTAYLADALASGKLVMEL